MAIGDVPSIASSAYSSTAYGVGASGGLIETTNTSAAAGQWFTLGGTGGGAGGSAGGNPLAALVQPRAKVIREQHTHRDQHKELMMAVSCRFVRVLIVDPNENVPLEDRIVYRGEEKFTDLTDTELYFELDIKDLLARHNEKRIKMIDKSVKERTEHLEPVKVRDLKMVVVNIASF